MSGHPLCTETKVTSASNNAGPWSGAGPFQVLGGTFQHILHLSYISKKTQRPFTPRHPQALLLPGLVLKA